MFMWLLQFYQSNISHFTTIFRSISRSIFQCYRFDRPGSVSSNFNFPIDLRISTSSGPGAGLGHPSTSELLRMRRWTAQLLLFVQYPELPAYIYIYIGKARALCSASKCWPGSITVGCSFICLHCAKDAQQVLFCKRWEVTFGEFDLPTLTPVSVADWGRL